MHTALGNTEEWYCNYGYSIIHLEDNIAFLQKRGPQRSVDTIVSAAFLLAIISLSLMCVEVRPCSFLMIQFEK